MTPSLLFRSTLTVGMAAAALGAAQPEFFIGAYSPRLSGTRGGTVAGLSAGGFDAVGPVYGVQDGTLAAAQAAGIGFVFTVGALHQGAVRGQAGAAVTPDEVTTSMMEQRLEWAAQIATQVACVVRSAANAAVKAWNITPEELRPWRANEMDYLRRAHDAVRENDPLKRPVMMFEPSQRSASELTITGPYQDYQAIGCYVHHLGLDHQRVFVRHQVAKLTTAIANNGKATRAVPMPVLEMYESSNKPYASEDIPKIPAYVRHDVYCALANGAKGFLVWSMGSRPGFSDAAYSNYYKAYVGIAGELRATGLRDVYAKGVLATAATVKVVSGETNLVVNHNGAEWYPSISVRDLHHRGTRYITLVNSSAGEVKVNLGGLGANKGYRDVLGGTKYKASKATVRAMALPPLGVAVLVEQNSNEQSVRGGPR